MNCLLLAYINTLCNTTMYTEYNNVRIQHLTNTDKVISSLWFVLKLFCFPSSQEFVTLLDHLFPTSWNLPSNQLHKQLTTNSFHQRMEECLSLFVLGQKELVI